MRRLLPLFAALLLLGACGEDSPTDEQQVRETLQKFATSVEGRDYQVLCDEVFAPELLEGLQEIGLPCEIAMQKSLGRVKEPKLTVGEVTVDGNAASAEVRTSAQGQAPSTDTLELEKLSGDWRVSALGGPQEEDSPEPPKATPEATRTPQPKDAGKPKPTPTPKNP